MKNVGFSAAIGLLIGIALVWWVRPDTNAGTVFLVVVTIIVCSAAGTILGGITAFFRKPAGAGPDSR